MDAAALLADGQYSFDDLVEMFDDDYIEHDAGAEALMLVEATLATRGLRELPVTEGLTAESISAVVDDTRAAWLVEHAPRVLGPGSEEFELWSESDSFNGWAERAIRSVAELRNILTAVEGQGSLL
ncbi:DUF4259 domain-containing protein [Myceligenerans salitolerans]|uniref:DUF4259 domain-containing protein n=2 Tax=Myceligenerans salitolerans TaxID=1230528 RepID=A0ABS3ICW2_9MICO|nr:DUF4259 domain-containing protein [Myceligenerans salitolerans]